MIKERKKRGELRHFSEYVEHWDNESDLELFDWRFDLSKGKASEDYKVYADPKKQAVKIQNTKLFRLTEDHYNR